GGGGMFQGVRGMHAGGMHSPTTDNLTDENILGKAYDNKVVMRLFSYLRGNYKYAILSLIAVIIYTIANVCIPLFIMLGIDQGINNGSVTALHVIGLGFLLLTLVHFGANYLQFVFVAKVGQEILYALRLHMFNHLQALSPSFFHRTPVGRIMSRSQSDVLQLQELFEMMVVSLADILSLGGIIVVMLVVDWQLALVSLSIIPILFLVLGYWQRFARRSFMRIRRAIAMVNGEYNQNITGVRVVQSLNRQDENLKHFNELNREHLNANLQASRFSGGLQPTVELLIGIGLGFGVVLFGGVLAQRGDLDWGVLVAFALWIQRFFEPVRHLTMQYSQFQRAMAAGVRLFELIDLEPEVNDNPNAIKMPTVEGNIQFKNASFHYVEGVEVLQNIDLEIKAGENVALVGSTGAGKSTFVTLIHRFADVTKGSILIDGYDIKEVGRQSLVNQMSMVLQDPFLFSGTVKENIRYNHDSATDEDVYNAAKAVGADEFISALDNGYDSVLAERGVNLSVGQRQLLSFARAVVGDPRILILDEATASIDTHTEVLIQNALQKILKGRTSIVIAHRLSTIRNADKIVVLDHGKVAEVGNHEQLLNKRGVYSRLYAINYGLGNNDTDEAPMNSDISLSPADND
ncbi:MAG: ABC transporter ATP-binding protein, partial [Chloroflexota bacterium]|nr:ABC transporter ATP-binding protein [Chloroflexota bacterium]